MRSLKILWSIHLYPPVHNCGSEYVAHHVNKYLIEQGHHVRVILHHDKMHGVQTPYMYEGVEVFGHTGNLDAYRWPDIIISHLDFTQYSIIMAASVKKPLVHFVHNDIKYNSIMNANKAFIVYNSDWIAKKLAYPWPSYTLHPPSSPKDYEVETTREAITLISLNKNKGGKLFYQIADEMPDRQFIGVVGSYDEQVIEERPNVTIIPNTPDILSVYRKTRILLMPSQYESWGRTATEAMCSGIPVICTPTPGLKENCGDAAIYVGQELEDTDPGEPQTHPGTAKSWADAIRRLDDEKEYAKYSLLCRERARYYSTEKELDGLHSFLLSAVANHHAG
jgi:glycosyltransferase involved in cell wall biosynthesis